MDSPHKWPVMRKSFPCHDVIMENTALNSGCRGVGCENQLLTSQDWGTSNRFPYSCTYHAICPLLVLSFVLVFIMTSWHGNAVGTTDPLWGNPQVNSGFLSQKSINAELLCSILCYPDQTFGKTVKWPVFVECFLIITHKLKHYIMYAFLRYVVS